MAAAPVANVGIGEQPDVEKRVTPAKFDRAERQRHHDADDDASEHDGVGPASGGCFEDADHQDGHAAADDDGADPVQRLGLRFLRRRDRERQREDQRGSACESPEDGLP